MYKNLLIDFHVLNKHNNVSYVSMCTIYNIKNTKKKDDKLIIFYMAKQKSQIVKVFHVLNLSVIFVAQAVKAGGRMVWGGKAQ